MSQYDELQFLDVVSEFWPAYESLVDSGWARLISMNLNSDKSEETYAWPGAAPGPSEWKGNRTLTQLNKFSITIKNKKYAQTIPIPVDDLRHDKTSLLRASVVDMAAKAADFPHVLISDLIINNGNAYDGQAFFSASHSSGKSGTQKNLLTSSEIGSANVATATAPTATEMANVINDTFGYMQGWLDDQGDPINGNMSSIIVMSGTAAINSAVRSAASLQTLASSSNPLFAAVQTGQLNILPVLNPRLSALTTNVFVFRADAMIKPFIHQIDKETETNEIGPNSEEAFKTGVAHFGADSARGAGYGNWPHAAKITLS